MLWPRRPLLRHHVGERRPTPRVGSIQSMKVVVYSHDADTRARIRLAIGRRPAPDVPEAEIVEVATEPALFRLLDAGQVDVMVLDGEAQPAGGRGRPSWPGGWGCAGRRRTRFMTARRCCSSSAGRTMAGSPPGRARKRWS